MSWQAIVFLGMVCISGPFKRSHHPLAETDQRCPLGFLWISEKTEGNISALRFPTCNSESKAVHFWVCQLSVHTG